MARRTFVPIDKYAHAGYVLLLFPALYWAARLLTILGVEQIGDFCDSFPSFAKVVLTVIVPMLTLLLGALSYIRHPREDRKLAYQSLIALSAVLIILFVLQAIDGTVE